MAIEHINEFDTLNAGREKINKHAIDPANRAELNSIDAKRVANQANQKSENAEVIAINTDDRLDNIIAGEMQDAEVIDARRPFGGEAYATLGERLDSEKAEVSAQLAQKANKSDVGKIADGTPLFADAVSEMTDPTRLYVNISDGYIYAHNSNLDAFESTGILYQATGTNEFPAKNLIKNGDFSEGIAGGWVANASTHSVSNNVLKNIADGTANYGLEQQGILNIPIGHKLYVTALVRVTSAEVSYLRLGVNYSSDSAVTINSPISGKTYNLSGVFQVITNTTPNIRFTHGYDTPITANGKAMELQNVVSVDLTEIFGLGNEPTVSELDAIMNEIPNRYFDGTLAPFVDNKTLYKNILTLNDSSDNAISGTPNQIEVSDTKKISIPKNPTLMQPVVSSAAFGVELAPTTDEWVGINGSAWNGTEWTIPAKGQLKTPITVESGAEYQIEVVWTTTNDYGVLNIPRLVVSLGTAVSVGQFTGYSDALYKLTLTANETGTVDLILGDGVEDWYATITSISVKKVIKKVTPAGRLGVGSFELTTMGDSIAIGNGLQKRTTGEANTALGLNALRDLTTGLYNVALGTRAMEHNQTGLNNVALGHAALRYLKSGYYNIGIGYSAMLNNVLGSWNIAIGNEAMRDLTTGVRNTVVGSRAMNDLTKGNYNVAMGREAGLYPNEVNNSTKTGSNNVFIGYRSGQSHNENTDESTAIGSYATARHRGTAIGRKTKAGGVGSVAIGTDSAGDGATSFEENAFVLGTSKHHVEVLGKLNIAQYTPTSSADMQGKVGDITSDDNYIYIKTSVGWKRNALETW